MQPILFTACMARLLLAPSGRAQYPRVPQALADSRATAGAVLRNIRADARHPYAALPLQPADDALKSVLANAGATLPRRGPVDERILRSVHTGTVTAKADPGAFTDDTNIENNVPD